MAIKAKAEITISRIIDIENVIRYYLLQSSSIAAPSKPTANPPGGSWSTTEPTYNSGATNSLYFTDLNIMSNGTYSYSAVSKSSSYEAAKEAWNKANNAQNGVSHLTTKVESAETSISKNNKEIALRAKKTEVTEAINNIDIGGRNLARQTAKAKTWTSSSAYAWNTWIGSDGGSGWLPSILIEPEQTYTLSFDYVIEDCTDKSIGVGIGAGTTGSDYAADIWEKLASFKQYGDNIESGHFVYNLSAKSPSQLGDVKYFAFRPARRLGDNVLTTPIKLTISNFKLERGNKATDWTPAPEDYYTKTETDAAIKVLSDKIVQQVSTTDALGTRLSKVEQDSDSWSVTLETANAAKSAADNASQTASSAKSAADKANENASSAVSTANTAKSTADTANSTADTARQEASDAAKTATNFMGFDSNGLVVGDRTANTLGKNVLIGNDSIDIRNGATVLAEFAEKLIAIGKGSPNAVIDFLNGAFRIASETYGERVFTNLLSDQNIQLGVKSDIDIDGPDEFIDIPSAIEMDTDSINMRVNDAGSVLLSNDAKDRSSRLVAKVYGQSALDPCFTMSAGRSSGYNKAQVDTGNGIHTTWQCNGGGTADINHYVKSTDGSTQIAQWSSCIRMLKNDKLVASYDGTTPVLLSTAVYPKADITRTLSKPVSQQPHGIVLVFAPYVNNAPVNYGLAAFFVPKSMNTGTSVCFVMAGSTFDSPCCKWIYIHDDKIVGNDVNAQSGTKNGVKYNNAAYVLTKVYGV